jgi:hypothetical protein
MKLSTAVALSALAATLFLVPVFAEAQPVNWGVRGGYNFDAEEPFIGVEAIFPVSRNMPNWYFNPNVEHVFGGDSFTSINADVHYDFDAGDGFWWLGAGAAAIFGDDSDFGLNIITGYGVRRGSIIPYVQLKGVIADDNQVQLGGGVRF